MLDILHQVGVGRHVRKDNRLALLIAFVAENPRTWRELVGNFLCIIQKDVLIVLL